MQIIENPTKQWLEQISHFIFSFLTRNQNVPRYMFYSPRISGGCVCNFLDLFIYLFFNEYNMASWASTIIFEFLEVWGGEKQ